MAVVAVWQCDRDGAMFNNKKDAEEHDRMLELAETIAALISQHISAVSETVSEEIGLLLARRRDNLAKACKGQPALLLEPLDAAQGDTAVAANVTPLVASS